MKVGLFDKEAAHLENYCGYDKSADLEWVKDSFEEPILFFTERCYDRVHDPRAAGKIKVAWPLEPRAIHSYAYDNLMPILPCFDYVMTFDDQLRDECLKRKSPVPLFWTPGGSWVWLNDWAIYPKSKMVSIVAGMKTWTEGHKFRQEVIAKCEGRFDLVCGYGRAPVEPKMEIFKDFRYSVVIENSRVNTYWTDKIVDCFACGTVPIFWGCPNIGEYFDPAGMICFQTINELDNILENLTSLDYVARLPAIQANFEKAKEYVPVEKFIFNNVIKKILEQR